MSTYSFNQLNGTFMADFPLSTFELLQEPQVVLKHQPMLLMPYLSMAMRSMPMPNARPE